MRWMRSSRWLGAALCLLGSLACTRTTDRVPLSVYAASSLTEAFLDLERSFEASHPGIEVTLNFAGSQILRLQVENGATADVLATADEAHMAALGKAGLVDAATTFGVGELVVIVPTTNPAGIESFADLSRASRIVIGADTVPVGAYTQRLLDRAATELGPGFADEVRAHVVSEESNVRLVRAKVELGEADAAIVYRTDAVASDRVTVVPVPDVLSVQAHYPIAVLTGSAHPDEARSFVDHVLSDQGRRILAGHGFAMEGW